MTWTLLHPCTEDNSFQVIPNDDLIEHEETDECVCGPEVELVAAGHWLVVHHPLDGRREPEVTVMREDEL